MKWHIGTSGWSYDNWQGKFYPKDLPAEQRLHFYAQHFNAVEINNSFYHLPKPETLEQWEDAVPNDFVFTVKGSRYITHNKKLKDADNHVPKLMERIKAQKHGGPVIFQLPPNWKKNLERLEQFIHALPNSRRYAIEFRDPDWHAEDVYSLLRKHDIAFCLFEKGSFRSPLIATTDFIYVRLHGRKENYKGNYSESALKDWYHWLAQQKKEVYLFFDNTDEDLYVIKNAQYFLELTA